MIKNRRILILSSAFSKESLEVAEELHALGNEIYILQGMLSSLSLKSKFKIDEIKPGFTNLGIEVGVIDNVLKKLGYGNLAQRLATEMVFELGKLFDVVLSFYSEDFVDLSVFYAKVNLLFTKTHIERSAINHSVDHVVVLSEKNLTASEIWKRLSLQNDPKVSKVLPKVA